eukprot:5987462-Pleurochrysis_carterae.AAC.1
MAHAQMDPDVVCCAQPDKAIDRIERSSIFLYQRAGEKIVEALRNNPAFDKLLSDWQKLKVDKDPGAKAAATKKKPLPQKAKAKARKARCR